MLIMGKLHVTQTVEHQLTLNKSHQHHAEITRIPNRDKPPVCHDPGRKLWQKWETWFDSKPKELTHRTNVKNQTKVKEWGVAVSQYACMWVSDLWRELYGVILYKWCQSLEKKIGREETDKWGEAEGRMLTDYSLKRTKSFTVIVAQQQKTHREHMSQLPEWLETSQQINRGKKKMQI